MLRYAIAFFVIALLAMLFGFGGIASSAVGIGQLLLIGVVVLAIVGLIAGIARRR